MSKFEQVKHFAGVAYNSMERAERHGTKEEFLRIKDGSPEWVTELVWFVHEQQEWNSLNDWTYEFIYEALSAITDSYDETAYDELHLEPDIYHHELVKWLGDGRSWVVDETMQECSFNHIFDLLQAAQVREKEEVLSYVKSFLEDFVDTYNDENEDEEQGETGEDYIMKSSYTVLELTVLLIGSILKRNDQEFEPEYLQAEALEHLEALEINPKEPAINHVEQIHAALLDWERDAQEISFE